ncbi:hypothetical protein [Bosea sp. (in: a-proteobacteria)]|uniref:hypothetical protein n=1 Tax=Bosea sp. (in: a-proteobacteria) TaxID=1871050 RepID=UPI001AC09CD8|nr:hypothetical protein [Bosea sp. (in: a-proteobacteria)]MBN9438468.1 hypothetical protein [Bosea sp. (in: a-proteobacteria)]
MTSQRTDSLARLAAKPGPQSLKSEFFALMPAIEEALQRKVAWKAILADLEGNGFAISAELAANYAAQYRRRQRPRGVAGKSGRPRRSEVKSTDTVQTTTQTKPILVTDGGRLAATRVASLRRAPDLD